MEFAEQMKQNKQRCNTAGFSALVWYAILNVAVILAMIVDAIVYVAMHLDALDADALMDHLLQSAMTNGWGYILATVVGVLILLLWKKKEYFVKELFTQRRRMTSGDFFMLLAVFLTAQALLQVIAPALEWLLNQIGLSAMMAMESASMTADTFSFFLYIAFLAPLAEELLFRGLILRTLEPMGKQFAIVVSSALFGLLHGNIIQLPFAFLSGLVMGYVAAEYSLLWAIVLHVVNNFVLSDLMNRLNGLVPGLGDWIFIFVMIAGALAAVVIFILRRKDVTAYFRENKVEKTSVKAIFRSPGMWIFGILMILMTLFSITIL